MHTDYIVFKHKKGISEENVIKNIITPAWCTIKDKNALEIYKY